MKDPLEDVQIDRDPPRQLRGARGDPRGAGRAVRGRTRGSPRSSSASSLMVMLHEAGHLIAASEVGDEGHRVLPRVRAAAVVVQAGRDRVRREGDPGRRLRPHHRHEQPRRGRRPRTSPARTARRHRQAARGDPRRGHGQRRCSPGCCSSSRSRATATWSRVRAPRCARWCRGAPRPRPASETGDRFVAVDGTPVASWDDLKAAIESHGGQETEFVVVRDGERVDPGRDARGARRRRASWAWRRARQCATSACSARSPKASGRWAT